MKELLFGKAGIGVEIWMFQRRRTHMHTVRRPIIAERPSSSSRWAWLVMLKSVEDMKHKRLFRGVTRSGCENTTMWVTGEQWPKATRWAEIWQVKITNKPGGGNWRLTALSWQRKGPVESERKFRFNLNQAVSERNHDVFIANRGGSLRIWCGISVDFKGLESEGGRKKWRDWQRKPSGGFPNQLTRKWPNQGRKRDTISDIYGGWSSSHRSRSPLECLKA